MEAMDKEDVVYIYTHTGILFSHKRMNLAMCNNMNGAREYNAKQSQSVRERQIPYNFIPMWNLRNQTDEHRGREKEIK